MSKQVCRLCGSKDSEVIYEGPIRSGGVGSEYVDGYRFCRCRACTFVFIDPVPESLEEFYKSEEYRLKFHYEQEVSGMQAKYDHEQNVRVARIGVENLRNKMVADFGAGAGLFLDSIKGVAKKTIAVEPAEAYREHLKGQGHATYPYAQDLKKVGELIDVATSFDAIEHVYDIAQFLDGVYSTLVQGGAFYVSMPQHNDIVHLLCPQQYDQFFYQTSHLNYFNAKTIEMALKNAGFKDVNVGYLHKYDMRNVVQWAQHGKPGAIEAPELDLHFHSVYKLEVERLGVASHLFVRASK